MAFPPNVVILFALIVICDVDIPAVRHAAADTSHLPRTLDGSDCANAGDAVMIAAHVSKILVFKSIDVFSTS
jgi:hypothetical protein